MVSDIEHFKSLRRFTWGYAPDNDLQVVSVVTNDHTSTLTLRHKELFTIEIPFIDRASQENAIH